MRRREFIAGLGSAMAASSPALRPLAAGAQEQVRRVGVLIGGAESDPEMRERLAAYRQGLEQLGWREDRNIRILHRFAGARPDQYERIGKELIAQRPEVLLSHTTPVTTVLQRETRTIPIVFVSVSDPIGSGLVASLARPGGNITGLMLYEEGIPGKWLAMLKEIAPDLVRVALIANPKTMPYEYYLRSARAKAPSLGIEVVPSPIANAADIQRTIEAFAQAPNGGIAVLPDGTSLLNRDLIITLAARYRLPTVFPFRIYVTAGGLMSYGTDLIESTRQGAFYVDRILRGANPADLPVQAPIKYQTTINLKTARALGFTVPPGLLVAADEVIE
jgi:putative ABC transport system substrate-binding protein